MAPSGSRGVIVMSAFEGLACAACAALAVSPGFIVMIGRAFPGGWVPGVLRLVLSLAALFTIALCGVRLRSSAPAVEWELGRTASRATVAITLAACASCGMALWDLFWVVPSVLALLISGAIAIAISPGRRGRHAAIAGASLAVLLLLPVTCWPLRVSVWLWRGSLDALSTRVERGDASSIPQWVGPFWIVKTRNDYESAFLVTRDEWGGEAGLARGTDESSAVNAFYEVRVGSGWWFVDEG